MVGERETTSGRMGKSIVHICTYIGSLLNSEVMTTAVLEIAAGHFPTSFNICPAKIYFDWLKLLFIFNGRAINNLQESPVFKKWPIDF